jgi:spermidine/putrescine transport system permease protein
VSDVGTSPGARRSLGLFFGLLVIFLYAPIVILAVFSFNDGDVSFPLAGFTLDWYRRFFTNPEIVRSLERSAIVATVSSAIAVCLGIAASFALLRRRFFGKSGVSALVFSPLIVPYVVFGIALLVIFTAVDTFLTETTGTYIGLGLHAVVIGHVVVSLPYTVLTTMPLLQRLGVDLDEAAKDLGAKPSQAFRRVTLPLLMPAVVASFLVAFTLSFDEFAIASFLAGESPTWPVYLFAQLRVPSQLPQLLAVSSVVLVVSISVVVVAEILRSAAERRYQIDVAGS